MGSGGNIKTLGVICSISLAFLFWFIPSENLFKEFMPRSVCMFHDTKLIMLHAIADSAIFIAYITIAICLFRVYQIIKKRSIPLKRFIWMFGLFILFCGLTHAIAVLNLFITYYWLDGAIKILTAIFSGLTLVEFVEVPSYVKDTYTGEEYRELINKNKELDSKNIELENRITHLEKLINNNG